MSTWCWFCCLKRCSLLNGVVRCVVHMFSVINYREFFAAHMTAGTTFDPGNN